MTVTRFRQGMLTDAEAQRRATTVYLADRRYDMLPGVCAPGSACLDPSPCIFGLFFRFCSNFLFYT